jgi:DNA-binding NtrC family response regulator
LDKTSGGARLRRLFIYEPNRQLLRYMQRVLGSSYQLDTFTEPESLLTAMGDTPTPDLVMLAWSSMETSMELLQRVASNIRHRPILLLSASGIAEEMAYAMCSGASGVIQKPFHEGHLRAALGRHLHRGATSGTVEGLTKQTHLSEGHTFVRASRRMREIEQSASVVATSEIPVLLLGESGTGKEVLARYIHSKSRRCDKMFLKINCAAMPLDLLESELFGYEKGAFTGATQTKPGKFEICDGGTIFLDEIGEMPSVLQAKLLHVLQDGTYLRLGGRLPQHSDVRVLAATNIDMKAAIAQKSFREDLYYRLNGFTFHLPPLRERKEEIGAFAHHFMREGSKKYGRPPLPLGPHLLAALEKHDWPGNLRELENVINRYLITADIRFIVEELVAKDHLRATQAHIEPCPSQSHKARMRELKGNAESVAIIEMLEETKWNRKEAARRLQVSYRTLLYKIRQYGLDHG